MYFHLFSTTARFARACPPRPWARVAGEVARPSTDRRRVTRIFGTCARGLQPPVRSDAGASIAAQKLSSDNAPLCVSVCQVTDFRRRLSAAMAGWRGASCAVRTWAFPEVKDSPAEKGRPESRGVMRRWHLFSPERPGGRGVEIFLCGRRLRQPIARRTGALARRSAKIGKII